MRVAKRRVLAIVVLSSIVGALAAPLPSAGADSRAASGWTSARGSASGDGYNAGEHRLNQGTVASLRPAWSEPFVYGYYVTTPPVVDNGVVFHGEPDFRVRAYTLSSGQLMWTSKELGLMCCSLAYAAGRVFAAPNKASATLTALDAASGKVLWQAAGAEASTPPVVADGLVYLGDPYGQVTAHRADTGALVWSTRLTGGVYGAPAIADGVVVVNTNGGTANTVALDAATGAIQWSRDTGAAITSPAIADGRVIVSGVANVTALDLTTGSVLWQASVGAQYYLASSPVVHDGRVYVAAPFGNLVALEEATGATLWAITGLGNEPCEPISAARVLYCSTTDTGGSTEVVAYRADDGRLLWTSPSGTGGWTPVVGDGHLLVAHHTGSGAALTAFALPRSEGL